MKKPVIGVTVAQNPRVLSGKYLINSPYIDAISAGGGIPLLIPAVGSQYAEQFLDRIDGLLLAGGEDVDPARYQAEPSCAVDYINEARDDMELSLLKLAVQRKIPVFGICRGLQLINVFFGGTLYQHLPSELPNCLCHVQDRSIRAQATHHVELYPGSTLEEVFGKRVIRVNSFHHQAIKDVAGDVIHVSAIAPDGVVEAIESDDGFIVATQWHPEEMVPYDNGAKRLFTRLVELASSAKK